jgi:phosphoribosylglycinamide formyltransferase 1
MSGKDIIKRIAETINKSQENPLAIAVLVSGHGSNLQALMDFSKKPESSYSIKTVIANNPGSRALIRAEGAGISNFLVDHRTFTKKSAFEQKIIQLLKEQNIELIVLAGFMRVLSPSFLTHFDKRVINLHPSLLPKHRGLDAINKALLAGDEIAGCTVHLVDEGLDTGPIIAQSSCPIFKHDDLEALTKRIQSLEHQLLPQVVNQVAQAVMIRAFA